MGSSIYIRVFWVGAAILLLTGPLLGIGVHRVVSLGEDTRARGRFDEVVSESAYLLEKQLTAFFEVLASTSAFFESSEHVTRREFADFTRTALDRHPGVQAIEWVPLVTRSRLADHERSARVEGLAGYRIWSYDGPTRLETDPPHDVHFPVYYVAPLAGNEAALGLDLGTESRRESAICRALCGGGPALTDPLPLVQGDGGSPAVLAFQRVGENEGVVLLVFEIADVIETTLFGSPFHDPAEYAFDLVDLDADDGPARLHTHGRGGASGAGGDLTAVRTLVVGGKRWRLEAAPTDVFRSGERSVAAAAGFGSALLWELVCATLVATVALSRAREMQRQNRLVGSVLAGMTEALVVADDRGRILLSNRAADRLFEIGRGETGPPRFLQNDGETPCVDTACPLARAASGERIRDEILCLHDDLTGIRTWLNVNGAPLEGRNGETDGGLIVMHDITDRKRADEVVEKLFLAVEQTDDAVFITTHDGRIEYVNPAFTRITGFSRDEAVGRTPRLLRSGEHPPEVYRALWSTILAGEVHRHTITNRRKNGELYTVDQTVTPMRDISGRISHFVSVTKDMTEVMALRDRETHMAVAADVQSRLYPQAPPVVPGLDLAGAVFPADQTCGDYYDYVELPDGRLVLVVADVCGHGLGAAMVMMETRATLRTLLETGWSPADALAHLNRSLHHDLETGRFVTMILVTIDPRTGRLEYVSAGHDTCYVLGADGQLKSELRSTGMPLGLVRNAVSDLCRVPSLDAGDVAILLTDGLIECQAHHGRFLEPAACLDAVRARLDRSADEIVEGLHALARDFSGDDPLTDDITIVVLKVGERDEEARRMALEMTEPLRQEA